MERGLRVGGGIIDVSHLKPRFASRTNEPEIAEKFSKRFLTRPCGRSNSRARRKRVVTIGGDRVLSAGWKTMGFDEPCQLTASTYADRYLGQRDYFFRRGRGRCSANSVQFERIPIIRLVYTNTVRIQTILEQKLYILLHCEGRSRGTPSMIGIPTEPPRSSTAGQQGGGGKQRNGITDEYDDSNFVG